LPRLKVRIKTSYGELEVSGSSPGEVLEGLGWLTVDFMVEVNEKVGDVAAAHARGRPPRRHIRPPARGDLFG